MNIKVRESIYYIGVIGGGVVGLLALFGAIPYEVAALIAAPLAAITGGTAGRALSKQKKDGTLDFTGSAPEQAVAAIQATINQATTAQDNMARVSKAVESLTSAVPGLAPAVESAGALVNQVIAQATRR